MALFIRSSSFMRYKVASNSSNHRFIKYVLQQKLASWSVVNSSVSTHKYSTVFIPKSKTDLSNRYASLILAETSRRNISTDNQSKLEALSSQTSPTANKVIFLESPPSSGEVLTDSASSLSAIPDVSETLTDPFDLSSVLSNLAEPTLSSLGLVNYTPVGLVQGFLEYLHIDAGMPWWISIIVATTIARTLIFPLFVKSQKNAAHLSTYMPQMHFLQMKFNEARRSGNSMEAAKAGSELMMFIKKYNVSPFKTALIPLLQAPVFLSYFMALRNMAKLPVESMKIGGVSWISDLTIPDPYYVMPLIACTTLYAVLKSGIESGMRMETMKMGKYLMYGIPVIMFPIIMNFQSAVLFYWCTNNVISLLLSYLMKVEAVGKFFNIPKRKPPDPKFIMPKKGFVDGFKESMDDQRILRALEERKELDNVRFQKAGTGPIPRTYSYDPTKPRPASAAAAASVRRSSSK